MDTRLRILKEAGILFSRMGIRAVTMDYIACQLGVSKRTIYELFSDKDDLLFQAISEGMNYHKEQMIAMIESSENVIDAIFKFAVFHNRIIEKIHPMFLEDLKKYHSNVYNSLNNNRVFDDDTILEHMLNRGIIDGMFRSDISVKLAGVFMRQTVKFCSLQHNDGENQFTKEDIRTQYFFPIYGGFVLKKV